MGQTATCAHAVWPFNHHAALVELGIKHLRFDTQTMYRSKPTSYGEKVEPSALHARRLCCL